MKTLAILWDFDGTLIDSSRKNFSVNQEIFAYLRPDVSKQEWPLALTSHAEFCRLTEQTLNWRRICEDHFGLTTEQAEQVGHLWCDYHAKNTTPMQLFDGISEIVKKFSHLSQGICSLNTTPNIRRSLTEHQLEHHFQSIIGADKTTIGNHKPHPEAFLRCLDEMKIATNDGLIFYIGDHHEDVSFARNAETALKENGKNIAIRIITASYSGSAPHAWQVQPDHIAHTVIDLAKHLASEIKT